MALVEDNQLLDMLKSIAIKCWRVFNLKGYARVDFRVDSLGQPWNTIPFHTDNYIAMVYRV